MICHSLIKQNNGELTFFSNGKNEGSTFMFTMDMLKARTDPRIRQIEEEMNRNKRKIGVGKKKKKKRYIGNRNNLLPNLTQVD